MVRTHADRPRAAEHLDAADRGGGEVLAVRHHQGVGVGPARQRVADRGLAGDDQGVVTLSALQRVDAAAGDQAIAARVAHQRVVTLATDQDVVGRVAHQRVVARGTGQPDIGRIVGQRGGARRGDRQDEAGLRARDPADQAAQGLPLLLRHGQRLRRNLDRLDVGQRRARQIDIRPADAQGVGAGTAIEHIGHQRLAVDDDFVVALAKVQSDLAGTDGNRVTQRRAGHTVVSAVADSPSPDTDSRKVGEIDVAATDDRDSRQAARADQAGNLGRIEEDFARVLLRLGVAEHLQRLDIGQRQTGQVELPAGSVEITTPGMFGILDLAEIQAQPVTTVATVDAALETIGPIGEIDTREKRRPGTPMLRLHDHRVVTGPR